MYLSKRESIATELRIALRRRRIKVVAESFFFGFSLFRIQCHITSALMFVKGIPQMKKKSIGKYWIQYLPILFFIRDVQPIY